MLLTNYLKAPNVYDLFKRQKTPGSNVSYRQESAILYFSPSINFLYLLNYVFTLSHLYIFNQYIGYGTENAQTLYK